MSTFNFRTPEEASQLLDISYLTAINYIHSGYLKSKKIGRCYLVPDEEIRDFIIKGKKRKPGRPLASTH
jgi:excisionase family DNA binding protein